MDTLPANEFCRRVFVLFQKGLNYLHNENTLIWAPAHYSTYIRNSLLFALLSHPSSWRTRMQSSLAQPNPRRRTSCTDRQITSLPTIHKSTPLGIFNQLHHDSNHTIVLSQSQSQSTSINGVTNHLPSVIDSGGGQIAICIGPQ